MKNFTCEVVETPMRRYMVAIKIGKLSVLIGPAEIDCGTNNARRIADFISENVESLSYAIATDDIAVDLSKRPN